MKTKLSLFFLLSFIFGLLSSQVPQGFNYQAIARDGSGNPIINTALPVMITIQADSLGTSILWQELHSSVTSNGFGMINLVIGRGTKQAASTVAAFSDIDWSITPKFIKTEIDYSGWKTMGVARLWSVPYALRTKDSDQWTTSGSNIYRLTGNVGIGTNNPTIKLQIGDNLTNGAAVTTPAALSLGSDYGSGTTGTNFKLKIYDTPTFGYTYGFGLSSGLFEVVSGTAGSIGFFTNGPNERMRINSAGNVGIGTTNPGSYKLNVNGGSVLINDGTGISGTLKLAGHSYIGSADWGNLCLNAGVNSGNAAIYLITENATRLTISGNGNVGIGTSAPAEKLHIVGNARIAGSMILDNNLNIGGYTGGVGNLNLFKLEVGGAAPSATNGLATIYLHHHGSIAHQLRYASGVLYLEAAGNGYGTSATPTFQVNGPLYAAMSGGKVGIGTASSTSKVAIQPESTWSDEVPLFEVKNKLGVPVLAVYNNGVRILVDHTLSKGVKSGFAVGGYDMTKAGKTVDFMIISPDSIRFNINNDNVKALKGGFAVGGYDATKGVINQDFMYITPQVSNNGLYNTFLGYQSGHVNGSTANYNSFIGHQAGFSNVKGYNNVFLGYHAGYSSYGPATGFPSYGINNIYIGSLAGELNLGGNNVLIGDGSGKALTNGVRNVYVGSSSGLQATGNNNTYIGSYAGRYETGSDNVCIGYGAGYGSGESGYLAIGNRTNAGLITGSFTDDLLYLWANVGVGTSSIGTYRLYVNGNAWATGTWGSSDARWKKNIVGMDGALNKIVKLNPVTFEWRTDEFPEINFDSGIQLGLVAQDVEEIYPELVKTNSDGYKAIAYDKLNAVLIKGMQEQQQQIESQQQQIESQQQQIDELKALVEKLVK